MEEKNNSKKQMSKGKKTMLNLFAVALIIGVTVVATLALLSTTTDTITNTFTASKDIKLELEEPNYNVVEVTAYPGGDKGNAVTATVYPKYGDEPFPGNFQPNVEYDKNPTLYNTTGETSDGLAQEWVAMRVDYYLTKNGEAMATQKTYAEMCANTKDSYGIIEPINFNVNVTTGSWIKVDLSQFGVTGTPKYDIYVYEYKLKAISGFTSAPTTSTTNTGTASIGGNGGANLTSQTTPLFEKVKVQSQDKLVNNGYTVDALPTFEIKLKGAAVKNSTEITLDVITSSKLTIANSSTTDYSIVKELVDLLKDK